MGSPAGGEHAERGRRPWFRYGCLGCLGVVALIVVALALATVVAFMTAQPPNLEDHVVTPGIPYAAPGDVPLPGRIVLNIREAKLRVEPADPGEPFRIEARYDTNAFSLEDEIDPGPDAWTYRATFGRGARAGAFAGLVSLARGSTASVHVFLPRDVPIDLDLDVKMGEATVRLAGLWLRSADVETGAAALDLSAHEPTREPMERLTIRTVNAGSLLNELGNASPRRLDVSYDEGMIDMDLSGRWQRDAEIAITGGMGGGVLHLPAGVILEGLDLGSIEVPTPSAPNPPTLTFTMSTGVGWLELSDIRLRTTQVPELPQSRD